MNNEYSAHRSRPIDTSNREDVLRSEISKLEELLENESVIRENLSKELLLTEEKIKHYQRLIRNAQSLLSFNNDDFVSQLSDQIHRGEPDDGAGQSSRPTEKQTMATPTTSAYWKRSSSSLTTIVNDRDTTISTRSARGNKGLDIAEKVYELLKDEEDVLLASEPTGMHYRDIVERLAAEPYNCSVGGKSPAMTLVAHIFNNETFYRPKRGYYGLAEWNTNPKGSNQRAKKRSR